MMNSSQPTPEPTTQTCSTSCFDDSPLASLLTQPVSQMTNDELRAFVATLQRLRVPQALRAKLTEREARSEPHETRASLATKVDNLRNLFGV